MSSASPVVIEGRVVDVARVDDTPIDRPVWARCVRAAAFVGLAVCAALAFVLFRHRHSHHRGTAQVAAAGALGGFLLGRHGARSLTHAWRIETRDGPVAVRMASGLRVDGLVAAGDRVALRGRFASSGVFCAYRGVNETVGLDLVPDHLTGLVVLGAAVAVSLTVVAAWIGLG